MPERQWLLHGAVLVLILAAGCGQRLPIVPESLPRDDQLSCAEIDREVRRAAQIRAAAIEEGKVQAINELIGAPDGQLRFRLGIIAIGMPVSTDGLRRHEQARLAADHRLLHLLNIKLEQSCSPRATVDPEVSDLEVARQLRRLDGQYATGKLDRRSHLAGRASLLELL